jgi:hypothetical protein
MKAEGFAVSRIRLPKPTTGGGGAGGLYADRVQIPALDSGGAREAALFGWNRAQAAFCLIRRCGENSLFRFDPSDPATSAKTRP